jgi:predicted transcriptional regulator
MPDTTLEECCNLMDEKQIRRITVVDEKGACCGILAQADIASNASDGKTAEVVQEVSRATA